MAKAAKEAEMTDYRVRVELDVLADSPQEAARQAYEELREMPTPPIVDVWPLGDDYCPIRHEKTTVDLEEVLHEDEG